MFSPDVGDLQGYTSNASVNTNNPRTGTHCLQFWAGRYIDFDFDATQEIYARIPIAEFDTRCTSLNVYFQNSSEGRTHVRFKEYFGWTYTEIYRGNTLIDTSPLGVHGLGKWTCFEFYVKIHDTNGIFQVKADGNLIHDFSGDTRDGGSSDAIDRIRVQASSAVRSYNKIDDVMIRTDGWCGQGGIYLLKPDSSGDTADWTASAGNDYDCVNDIPPDFTDYIYEDSANKDSHLFNCDNLPAGAKIVNGVKVQSYAKLDVTGSGILNNLVKSGTTTVSGGTTVLTTSDSYPKYYLEDDPDTSSAWTVSGINNLQIGVEVV
jgi:hypothetical protein